MNMKIKRTITLGIVVLMISNMQCINVRADEVINNQNDVSGSESLDMTEKQLNAISILNYMLVLSQEINESENSKIYLDNAYSSIVNNINPNAVDNDSMSEIQMLLDTINSYQSIDTKRERLEYTYQQNQAKAINKAIPNPLSVLNLVESDDSKKALISVIYMAIDSVDNYTSYKNETEEKYMQDGWALDDEAKQNLHESRSEAFKYMIEMCNKNNLDGKKALNENAVAEFVKMENEENVTRRIIFLENNQDTYSAYGKYWLVLAKSYYDEGMYQKCLDAISQYEKMNIIIFRKDHDFAKTLVVGLSAANEVMEEQEYVELAKHYLDLLLNNIDNNDWILCYTAAETYLDIYAKTNEYEYLKKAYDLIKNNINNLIDVQRDKNDKYLADIVKETPKKTDSKEVKKEIKNYNKEIEEQRKVELPPIYEPLVINCELLFELAEKLRISPEEKNIIDNMLHDNGKTLFLNSQIDNKFYFNSTEKFEAPNITFDGEKIIIPANILCQNTEINVTVIKGKKVIPYNDWNLIEVNRDKQNDVNAFNAIYKSKQIKKCEFEYGDEIKIELTNSSDSSSGNITYVFIPQSIQAFHKTSFKLEGSYEN